MATTQASDTLPAIAVATASQDCISSHRSQRTDTSSHHRNEQVTERDAPLRQDTETASHVAESQVTDMSSRKGSVMEWERRVPRNIVKSLMRLRTPKEKVTVPPGLQRYQCEARPLWLPRINDEIPKYEPLIWWLVQIHFNEKLELHQDLYKEKVQGKVAFALKFSREAFDWKPISRVLRLFNVYFAPEKLLNWVSDCHRNPTANFCREKKCFRVWFKGWDADLVTWLVSRMGVQITREESEQKEAPPGEPICRELMQDIITQCLCYCDAQEVVDIAKDSHPNCNLDTYINISALGSPMIPPQVFECERLVELHARHNAIQHVPSAIGRLVGLEVLHLSHNRIAWLPKEITACVRLRVLALDHNALQALPHNMDAYAQLKVLNCSFNQLKSLPESLGLLGSSLQEAYFSYNEIEEVPHTVLDLFSLKKLHLNANRLKALPLGFDEAWSADVEVLYHHNLALGFRQEDGTLLYLQPEVEAAIQAKTIAAFQGYGWTKEASFVHP